MESSSGPKGLKMNVMVAALLKAAEKDVKEKGAKGYFGVVPSNAFLDELLKVYFLKGQIPTQSSGIR